MSAVNIGTASKSYNLGGRNLVRTDAGALYACVLNSTDGKVEMWRPDVGGNGTIQDSAHSPSAYTGSASNTACAIDSAGLIHVAYYVSSTAIYYNTFNTSTNTWGTPAQISTKNTGATLWCAIALDGSGIPHVVFNDIVSTYSITMYANKVGGSWNTPVTVESGVSCQYLTIAIDTTNSANHRYNIPQIAYCVTNNGQTRAALGNANNATSFIPVRPASQSFTLPTQSGGISLIIDSNGTTHIFTWRNTSNQYSHSARLAGNGTWDTAHPEYWIAEENFTSQSTIVTSLTAIANGSDRYYFCFYNTPTIKYIKSTVYGTWITPEILLESPSSANAISSRWQYDNNPSYLTYGIDFLFTIGTGTNNLYWDNLALSSIYNVTLTLNSVTAALAGAVNVGMIPATVGLSAGSSLSDGVIGSFPGSTAFPTTSGLSQDSQQAMLSAMALAVSAAFGLSNTQAMQLAMTLAGNTSFGLSPAMTMQVALNLAKIGSILAMGGGEVSGSVALSGTSVLSLQMSKSLLGAMALNVVALLTPVVQATLAASEILAGRAALGATPTIITQGGLNLAAVTAIQASFGQQWLATLSMEAQTALGFSGGCDVLAKILLGATSEIIFSLPALVIIRGGFKILVACSAPELYVKVSDN